MVITISREYGAYGHSVARALSEKLGIEYYDKDFVKITSNVSGYSEDDIRREGEDMSDGRKFINQFLGTNAYNSSYDAIFEAEREVVLDLAKKPCIIVGRCANITLREEGIPSFDIFLYADIAHRRERVKELGEYGKTDINRYIEKRDHWRKTYYRAYTGREMGDYRDYTISLDIGVLGKDRCVELLYDLLKDRVAD